MRQSPQPKALGTAATDIATQLIADDARDLLRMLRTAGLIADEAQPVAAPASAPPVAETMRPRVGIWEQESAGGAFVRSLSCVPEWHLWANVGRIGPKGAKRRVVFLGESAARGYLYDPAFTPVMALRSMLQWRLGADALDVVDLARTDLGLEIEALALSADRLMPDAVVVFAGNNWSSDIGALPLADRDAALRRDGVPGLQRAIDAQLARQVRQLTAHVCECYAARGVPVVWVVPEFNLRDWREPPSDPPYLFSGAREWLDCGERAEAAVRRGALSEAIECAERMIALDGGAVPRGLYILGDCYLQLGRTEAARNVLERARDAAMWDASVHQTPRATSVVQAGLRALGDCANTRVVDLPALFEEDGSGGVPGRRHFLDYCHLTASAIRLSMAAVAERILELWNVESADGATLIARSCEPNRRTAAEAAFLAAVHNAHGYQPYEAIKRLCDDAVRHDPGIAAVMRTYAELQTRRCPALLSSAGEAIVALESPLVQKYLLQYNHQQLDAPLLSAIAEALEPTGTSVAAPIEDLRVAEHAVDRRRRDLLDPYYCSSAGQPRELMWALADDEAGRPAPAWYRAFSRRSRFVFVAARTTPVVLEICCRLPVESGSASVAVGVNEAPVAMLTVHSHWTTHAIHVDVDALTCGVNDVCIEWPQPCDRGRAAIDAAADDLLRGFRPQLYQVFGELHSFTASPVSSDGQH